MTGIEQFLNKPEIKESILQNNLDTAYTLIDEQDRSKLTSWLYDHDISPLKYVDKIYSSMFDRAVTPDVIIIPDNINEIERYGFHHCRMKELTFNNYISRISDSAFAFCSLLTSIKIPDSVTIIDGGVFFCCSSLTSVMFGENSQLKSIGSSAFSSCSSLVNIKIPDSVTGISDYAFEGCKSLTSIEIPDSATSIGHNAFEGCRSLQIIEIPDGVTSIGEQAFYKCSSLTSIVIPNSVTSIGEEVFKSCDSLTSIKYDGTKKEAIKLGIGNRARKKWRDGSKISKIICTDGVIDLQ